MVKVPSPEIMAERWVVGMLKTPPVPCPVCGRRTRAESQCQYCKTVYTSDQNALRDGLRKLFMSSYSEAIKLRIKMPLGSDL